MNIQDVVNNNYFINSVNRLFDARIRKKNLEKQSWRYGIVDSITSTKIIRVFLNNELTSTSIACSPDDSFLVGDKVLVLLVNNDSRDMVAIKNLGQ